MPTFRFPLEVGGPKRLTITMPAFKGATLIDLDGQRVGAIPLKRALADGQALALPDGRELHVAFKQGLGYAEWSLMLDGIPLPGSASDPRTRAKAAAGGFFALAGISFLISVFALALPENELLLRAGGLGGFLLGPLLALFGWLTWRGSFWGCAVGTLFVLVDTVSIPFIAASPSSPGLTGGLVMRVFLLAAMIRGARSLWAERRAKRSLSAGAEGAARA